MDDLQKSFEPHATDFLTAQPINLPDKDSQPLLLNAWENFVHRRQIDPIVQPLVASSWKRCWARVNPFQHHIEFIRMSKEHLLTSQVASFDLISIARPILEDIYQNVKDSGTGILLLNNAGCLLDVIGDAEILEIMEHWKIGPGVFLTEDRVGTNALGLALIERMPVQVTGAEHYVQQFHETTGAAAPVFDPAGHLLGVIGIVMPLEKYHVHSLGLVTAGARAVEGQHQADLLLTEQNSQLSRLNAVLSAISEGILVWSAERILIHANAAACRILNLPLQALVGKKVDALFSIPTYIYEAIGQRKTLVDEETIINVAGQSILCLISLNYVFSQAGGAPQWVIVTLRAEKQIRKLVQKQVGASAVLTLEDITGESHQIHRVRQFVKSAASTKASMLVRGETGTGKNVLARAIHNASAWREGPFVIFACSSVPNELVISELLGYDESISEKKNSPRPSKFELAQGGTLFFQDVDALPLEAQTVLLNALELGIIQRLGSQRAIEIDTRVIASTSANIEALIAQSIFRADLFYRLSIFSITLPPLRERPNDIPLIVDRFLKRLSVQLAYPISLGSGVIDALKRYPWPGNIRELEAVLGRCATRIGTTGVIELENLPSTIRYVNRLPSNPAMETEIYSLSEVERRTIIQTAQLCRGNLSMMAQALGIGRTTLWRRMKVYQIDPQDYRKTQPAQAAPTHPKGHS